MENLDTIRMTQNNIATGHDDSETTIMAVVGGEWGVSVMSHSRAKDGGYKIYALVKVIHPSLLAGTWAEFVGDCERVIIRKLTEAGRVTENKYGVTFWEQK